MLGVIPGQQQRVAPVAPAPTSADDLGERGEGDGSALVVVETGRVQRAGGGGRGLFAPIPPAGKPIAKI